MCFIIIEVVRAFPEVHYVVIDNVMTNFCAPRRILFRPGQ